MNLKVLMAATAAELSAINPHVTVEAEFGTDVVEGGIATFAHHTGIWQGSQCPCVWTSAGMRTVLDKPVETVGVSHIDLDTIGCLGAILGNKPGAGSFWFLAALVDVTGPHNPDVRGHYNYPDLLAYWARAQKPENRAPRMKAGDGVLDVTELVHRHLSVLADIFGEGIYGSLHKAGKEMEAAEQKVNVDSFCGITYKKGLSVIARTTEVFVNHLYTAPSEEVCDAVVAFNTKFKSLTLSFRDDSSRGERNAAAIMQKVFGPEAGGHPGIAGTPRGKEFEVDAIQAVLEAL